MAGARKDGEGQPQYGKCAMTVLYCSCMWFMKGMCCSCGRFIDFIKGYGTTMAQCLSDSYV